LIIYSFTIIRKKIILKLLEGIKHPRLMKSTPETELQNEKEECGD